MIGKYTLLLVGLLALTTVTLAQMRPAIDEPEPPGSLIDIDTELGKDKEEVAEESGSGRDSDDEDDEDLDKSSGSGSGAGFTTDREGSMEKMTTIKPLSPCQNLHEASKHLLGNYVPKCDKNGDYAPMQCRGHASTGRCWCSDRLGAEIPGTAIDPPKELNCESGKSLSPCLFKLVQSIRAEKPMPHLGAYHPKCKINGDFEERQCHGSICFCVDSDGEIQYGTKKPIHKSENMCVEKLLPEPEETMTVKAVNTFRPEIPEKTEKPIPTKPVDPKYTIGINVNVGPGTDDEDDDSAEDKTKSPNETGDDIEPLKEETKFASAPIMTQPGLLAAIIGGAVVGLLCAILLVMFIVYRMRKKDEGSYALDEPRKKSTYSPINQSDKEYYA